MESSSKTLTSAFLITSLISLTFCRGSYSIYLNMSKVIRHSSRMDLLRYIFISDLLKCTFRLVSIDVKFVLITYNLLRLRFSRSVSYFSIDLL